VPHAVGGGQYIVRNGAIDVDPHDPGFADVTHPRTAIGIQADGDVVMATVDGRQPGYSIGVRLDELGELMLERGVVTAINLDGGGSTTMAVRLPGDDGVTVVNRGSDGFERAVSNSLVVFSTAPTGPLARLVVKPADAVVYAGSAVSYTVRGQDDAHNAVAVDSASIAWSVTGGVGTIDAAGRLTTTTAGEGTVNASVGAVTGSVGVRAINVLADLAIQPNPALVEPGAQQAFALAGSDGNGAPVIIDGSLATWSVTGPIGTISSSGVLTASSGGSGLVSASLGGMTATASVDVGRPPVVLEDFEDIADMRAASARASATLTPAMRPAPVRFGTRSARLGYDFTTGTPGTSAAYAEHSPLRDIDGRPLRIGVWLYGDGSRHWVRANYRDGNNTQRVLDFTPAPSPTPTNRDGCALRTGGIDWVGWKYLQASIPPEAVLPLRWERVYVVETVDLCDNASAVYLDDLRAVYSETGEDLVGPAVTDLIPAPGATVHTSQPLIGGTVRDEANGSGVAPASIRLLIDEVQIPAEFDPATGAVRGTPPAALADGLHRARLEAQDNAGNPALPFGDWTFRIYTGPDRDPPVIDRALPLDGTASLAGRPRISARIRDTYRGVDPGSLRLWLEGNVVSTTWDADADVLWYAPPSALLEGVHTVAISASDREAPPNVSTTTWSFTVQPLAAPAAPFHITWIADGGYFEGTRETAATAILAEHLAREAASPPALLVFGGDLVENDQQINYDRAVTALAQVPASLLVAAGNHEISGSLSRERFWRTFGPTTAAADFGPVDFLILDTASSTLSHDTSQFGWLEQELTRGGGANTVFIVAHVPTRDPFGSAHGLPAAEGLRLEQILAAAKAARPARDIVVLSGDAHAYARWKLDGVTYLISGGGGGGPDALPVEGGFYHRLRFDVAPSGAASIAVVPLFEQLEFATPHVALAGGEETSVAVTGDVFTASAPDMTIPVVDPIQASWSTSNPGVALVDPRSGRIHAYAPGEAIITVTSGGAAAEIIVSVTATVESLHALTARAYSDGAIAPGGIRTALLSKLDAAAAGEPGALEDYLALLRA
jgi:Phosphodiester glycosidase